MAGRSRRARILSRVAWAVLGLVVLGSGALGGLLSAPFPTDATVRPEGAVVLTDSQGRSFAQVLAPETKIPLASLDDVSPCMINAITAAEDERYFKHRGVDPRAIGRAFIADVTGTGRSQGGSTITQQYVKLVYTGSERTKLRKVREASLAVRLEQRKSKREILRLYLNAVNFGNGLIGVEAAARDYFGVHAKDLDCAQSALLAGSVNAPSLNNPRYKQGANAAIRQRYVISRMVVNKLLSPEDATKALAETITLQPVKSKARTTIAPEYTDAVLAAVRDQLDLGSNVFANGALTIHTPLDLELQKAATSALDTVLPDATDPEAAIVAIDPRDGAVRALATKRDGGYTPGGFNLATDAQRNSGSTVKPFTLAAALASGDYTPESRLTGAPTTTVQVPGCQPFKVKNAEDSEGGNFSLRSAMEQSVNTVYGPLAVSVGLTKMRDVAVAAGVPASAFEGAGGDCPVYPSQSLGIGKVTPLDLTHAYATLSAGGVRHDLQWISDVSLADSGGSLYEAGKPVGTQAIAKGDADQVVDVLRGVVRRGTGTLARPSGPTMDLYGKTGTTDDFTNAWFVGCNPTLCIGIWMGYDSPKPMLSVHGSGPVFGGTLPAKIFSLTFNNYETNRRTQKLPALPSGAQGSALPVSTPPSSPSRSPSTTPKPKRSAPSTSTAPASPVAPVVSSPASEVPPTAAPPNVPSDGPSP